MPEMPFEVIDTSEHGSYEIPGGVYVVRDQLELEAFWARLKERISPRPAPPVVTWSKAVAVFVLLGTRPTLGYRIRVERVAPSRTGVRVHAVELTPPPDVVTGQALTAPYQMVSVSGFDGIAELCLRSEAL